MTEKYPLPSGKEVTIKFQPRKNRRIVAVKVKWNNKKFSLNMKPIYEKDETEPGGLLFKPHLN